MIVVSYAIALITSEYALLQLQFQFQLIHRITIGQMKLFHIILSILLFHPTTVDYIDHPGLENHQIVFTKPSDLN